jgi:hypothetical protein
MHHQARRLAADIESSDSTDPRAQGALYERIQRLRSQLDRARGGEQAAYLDCAAELVQYLVHMGRMGPDQVLRIAASLVRKVEGGLEAQAGAPPRPAGGSSGQTAFVGPNGRASRGASVPLSALPGPGSPAAQAELGSIEERLLGEVMLQLGMVTKKQLEQGLVHQRATDQRIGEALVSLGAATWSQVEQAMAVQRRLRATPGAQRPR